MMRHPFILNSALLLSLTFTASSADAQSDIPLRKIRAVKPASLINMLDSVVSDNYRKIYKYNEYGYITSVMTYRKDAQWTLDTSTSYVQDYVFNDDGQCTSRIRYHVDEHGNKGIAEDKGELVIKDGKTWEYTYEHNDDGKLHPVAAKAYDEWGNLSVEIAYETDRDTYEDYISSYHENRYSGYTHQGHYNQSTFQSAYLTYNVEAKIGKKTMNLEELNISYGQIIKWEMLDGKLYRKNYGTNNLDSVATLANFDKYLTLISEEVYELNSDGTRPVKLKTTFSPGQDFEYSQYNEYTWDDKGRLVGTAYKTSDDADITRTQTYTYADDYAKELSLMDAVYAIRYELAEYPEDEFCQFGHLSTGLLERNSDDEKVSNSNSFTWDDNGHLVSSKWTKSGSWSDMEYYINGEILFYYNTDGHMSYIIGKELRNDDYKYYKDEYVYNDKGTCTGVLEYSGESMDGPWTLGNDNSKMTFTRSACKSAAFIDDMSDGSHFIDTYDGDIHTSGYYRVEEGKITYGRYQQYIYNRVSIPQNPELNYTDPEIPLDITDEWVSASETITPWLYEWDIESEAWKLLSGPEVASHIYKSGNDIICDTYNREQTKTGTTTYSLDDAKRLVKQSSEDCEITYEYLADDSNYLLESVTTTSGKRIVLHYYYSLHNYTPTAIKTMETSSGKDTYYDLQGRRIATPPTHGIYIVNGKKVVK